jgi:hypothetical protein
VSQRAQIRNEGVCGLKRIEELGTARAVQDVLTELLGLRFGELAEGQSFEVTRVRAAEGSHHEVSRQMGENRIPQCRVSDAKKLPEKKRGKLECWVLP